MTHEDDTTSLASADPGPGPANSAAEPAPAPSLADGVLRQLDPAYVRFQQVVGLIFSGFVAFALLIGAVGVWLSGELPWWASAALAPAWLLATVALGSFSVWWPSREYRCTAYRIDEEGIEIRTGVWWRAVMNVPRSRVQHIDVSQGPIERSYGLGRLVIYTAGTAHSRVELPGLNHARAFMIRNHLLPRGSDDAV
jgi:uncharacterized protein